MGGGEGSLCDTKRKADKTNTFKTLGTFLCDANHLAQGFYYSGEQIFGAEFEQKVENMMDNVVFPDNFEEIEQEVAGTFLGSGGFRPRLDQIEEKVCSIVTLHLYVFQQITGLEFFFSKNLVFCQLLIPHLRCNWL